MPIKNFAPSTPNLNAFDQRVVDVLAEIPVDRFAVHKEFDNLGEAKIGMKNWISVLTRLQPQIVDQTVLKSTQEAITNLRSWVAEVEASGRA